MNLTDQTGIQSLLVPSHVLVERKIKLLQVCPSLKRSCFLKSVSEPRGMWGQEQGKSLVTSSKSNTLTFIRDQMPDDRVCRTACQASMNWGAPLWGKNRGSFRMRTCIRFFLVTKGFITPYFCWFMNTCIPKGQVKKSVTSSTGRSMTQISF